jgi:hypothetical protein
VGTCFGAGTAKPSSQKKAKVQENVEIAAASHMSASMMEKDMADRPSTGSRKNVVQQHALLGAVLLKNSLAVGQTH